MLAAALATPPLAAAPRHDTLTPLLAGEFAYQAGQLEQAARWYLQAAQAADDDAALAERATRLALLANDDRATARALRLWRQRAPESEAMRAATATLYLRQGRLSKARRELEACCDRPIRAAGAMRSWH